MAALCKIPCIISVVFMFSMIYMSFGPQLTSPGLFKNFQDVLDSNQIKIYDRIVKERLSLYLSGYGLGFILSAILIFYNRSLGVSNRLTDAPLMCTVGTITFITNYFYYILSPKSDWMVLHLKTEEQKEQWLNVYKNMQWNYHFSFLLGILAIVFLAKGCN
jgi:hypothetical protein